MGNKGQNSELLTRANFSDETLHVLAHCPVCAANADTSEAITEDFIEVFGEPHFFSVDLCPACGAVFSRARSINEKLYSPELDLEKEHGHQRPPLAPLSEESWNFGTKSMQVAELIRVLGADSTVKSGTVKYVEVGASDGTLFRMFRERAMSLGCNVEGILIESSGAALPCEAIEGCRVIAQSVLDVSDVEPGSCDVAVLSHCLEHFDNPREVIAKVGSMLRPGGVLYVEVPDGLRFDRSISAPLGYFHIVNFNILNLSWMIEALGFDLTDAEQRDHYPGIRVIARRSEAGEISAAPIGDVSAVLSRSGVRRWREEGKAALARLDAIGEDARVLVYGAGTHAVALLRHKPEWLRGKRMQFADSNPRIDQFLGRSVLTPDQIDFADYDRVVISSYAYQDEIARSLVERGCPATKLFRFYDDIFAYVG
jgi:SAM-dependent methyltransferase